MTGQITLHLSLPKKLPSFYNQAIEGKEISLAVSSCGAAAHHKVGFGISIGVAHNQQSPNLDVAQLVSRADLAMYHAKKFSLGIFHYHNFPEHQD